MGVGCRMRMTRWLTHEWKSRMSKVALIIGLITFAIAGSTAHADECDAVAAEISATIKGVEVGERVTAPSGAVNTIALKNPAADDIKLSCAARGTHKSNEILATWHTAYPPPAYFDFLAEAASIVASKPSTVMKRGALACQKQALTTDVENTDIGFAGVHIKCTIFTRNGGGTTISISSQGDAQDLATPIAPRQNNASQKSANDGQRN